MIEKQFVRIEHASTGRGMYMLGDTGITSPDWYEDYRMTNLIDRHRDLIPNYCHDMDIAPYFKNLMEPNDFRFAFKSIENLQKLVLTDEFKILNDYGFRVFAIASNGYVESPYQAIFNINSVLKKEDITELFIK